MPLVLLAGTWGGRDSLGAAPSQTLGRFPSCQFQARAAAAWCGSWTPGRRGQQSFFTRSVSSRGPGEQVQTESLADRVSPRAHAEGRRGPCFLTGRAEPTAASDTLEVVGMGLGTRVPELADGHVTCAVAQGPVLGGVLVLTLLS